MSETEPNFYRKKPVVIEAIRWNQTNFGLVVEFAGDAINRFDSDFISIDTLEGSMVASPGDWIIKGIKGEFYPCKPDIFEATYDLAV